MLRGKPHLLRGSTLPELATSVLCQQPFAWSYLHLQRGFRGTACCGKQDRDPPAQRGDHPPVGKEPDRGQQGTQTARNGAGRCGEEGSAATTADGVAGGRQPRTSSDAATAGRSGGTEQGIEPQHSERDTVPRVSDADGAATSSDQGPTRPDPGGQRQGSDPAAARVHSPPPEVDGKANARGTGGMTESGAGSVADGRGGVAQTLMSIRDRCAPPFGSWVAACASLRSPCTPRTVPTASSIVACRTNRRPSGNPTRCLACRPVAVIDSCSGRAGGARRHHSLPQQIAR